MKLLLLYVLAITTVVIASPTVKELAHDVTNAFTNKMLNEVLRNNPGKSVVQSALSVLSPLAQLALASEGETHNELLRVLNLPNDKAVRSNVGSMIADVRAAKGVNITLTSRIYVKNGLSLNNKFSLESKTLLESDVKNIDFTKKSEAAKEINDWVENNTNHKIKDLVNADSLNEDTRAILVNTIYFKGNWSTRFDEHLTRKSFHVDSRKSVELPFMSSIDSYNYYNSRDLDAKFLDIPYEGGEVSLLVALPDKVGGVQQLQRALTPQTLSNVIDNMSEHHVNVSIPKFKIETQINLKDVLNSLGVKKVFNNDAELPNLLLSPDSDVFVSEAIQKAFIEIDEYGTQAAAANEIRIQGKSLVVSIRPPEKFNVDHPFIFVLKKGHSILFNGVFLS